MGQAALETLRDVRCLSSFTSSRETSLSFLVALLRQSRSQLAGHSGVNSEHPSTLSAEGQQALAVFCF